VKDKLEIIMNINLKPRDRKRFTISGKILLTQVLLLLFFTSCAAGATITFDKSLDVPDRDFTVTYEGSTFSYTVSDIGNYKTGEDIGVTVSGGVSNMRLVLFTVDKLTPWFKPFNATSGSISTTIPANRFDSNCPDVCDDPNGGYKMGPGIYALVVQNLDDSKYFIAKPVIVSEYSLSVAPNTTQTNPGSVIKVTVTVSKDGAPVSVAPNNVEVEFVQDSTSTHFGGYATATATGTYEATIQVPTNVSGSYRLYAAIATNRNIYQDYPELIGAVDYSGAITVPAPTSTSSAPPTATPSSNGGGSVPSGEELKNIELKETYEKYISKDAPASYVFSQSGNPVSEVSITSNINAGDIAIKIEVLRGTSSLVSSPPSGTVYKNIDIWVGTSGFAVPKNIKEAFIKFRVENSWITSNNLASSDVHMIKWDGSKWAQIVTSEKNKDATYTYYEAKTDSFSAFAITGLKGVIVPTATPEGEVTETPLEPTVTPTAATTKKGIPSFEGIMTIVAIAVLVASLNNHRKRR